jgi:hypothetical protein
VCMVPALYLWERGNFVSLFEHMLQHVESIGFVRIVWEECIFSNGEVGMLSFVGPSRPYIPCN